MKKVKSVILLSGGLDSTVNAWIAKAETEPLLTLTFDYGQRAGKREIAAAKAIASRLQIPHKTIELPWFSQFTETALVSKATDIPLDTSLDDLTVARESAKAVWVPNRNGIFLNIAAAFAEGLGAKIIIPGFNKEEAATFPDNSLDYMGAATQSLYYSTANHVEVRCFTAMLNKTEIVKKGREVGVDFSLVWPCYFGEEKPCGKCESCRRFRRALGE